MDEDHQRRADDLEREADRLDQRSDELGREIQDVREDWEAKKKSEETAGAVEADAAAPGGLGEEEEPGDDRHADEGSD